MSVVVLWLIFFLWSFERTGALSCNEIIGTSDGLGCNFACCNKEPQGLLQIWKNNGSEKERLNGTQITNGSAVVEASITIGMDSNQQFTCRVTSEICPMHTIPITCTVGSVLKLKCILVVRQDNSTCSHSQEVTICPGSEKIPVSLKFTGSCCTETATDTTDSTQGGGTGTTDSTQDGSTDRDQGGATNSTQGGGTDKENVTIESTTYETAQAKSGTVTASAGKEHQKMSTTCAAETSTEEREGEAGSSSHVKSTISPGSDDKAPDYEAQKTGVSQHLEELSLESGSKPPN